MSSQRDVVLANLRYLRVQGVGIANMAQAVGTLIDAVAYLVQNTPEAPK